MSAKREILVVEDNEINREILCSLLADNYTVWEAENGQVALDILGMRKSSISLILLDVMMPVMDGYTFLDRIKEDATLALIPVIVMTQGTGEEDELAALAHGATDFVPKPYRPKIIQHRIAALIQLRETAALVNYLQYDRLTGLYCKEYFYKKVQQRLEEDLNGEYCILCANVENFKLVNEIFGARRGENLLKMIADRMRDMIGSRGFCARFGTDRFLALYRGEKGQSSRKQLSMLTKQTFDSLPENAVIRCGLYEIDDRMVSAEQMCDRAMLSVDRIKNQYDQHFAIYDDAIRSNMLREQAITTTMEHALNNGQFHMYLQPKFSLNESCISGAEALVRWIHPNWGFVSPGEFIPLFEKTGFIVRLDQYIWEQACIRLRAWADRGWKQVAISVNVSRVDVFHINVPEYIFGLTSRYGVDPALLHIEITESAYGEYPEQIISAVEELRNRGFIVEMDDFGSGYSSLNMLSRISLDILKLDMKFTQNELAKPEDQSFLGDVIHMAHRLRLGVVAEGVETREQMNRLQEIGCDYVQGYYFSKPLPIGEFEARMEEWQRTAHDSIPQDQRRSALPNSILVADCDGAYRQRICEAFKNQYRMLEAEDAESALAQIEKGDSSGLCAVILSTILPGGISKVLDMLHQRPPLWGVSVMAVIPGSACVKDNPLAMAADDFICKEHPIFDVHKRVMRMIENASFRQKICVLQDVARRDPLTGLLNRRGFQDALHAIQSVDMPLAVCVFDLDDLKKINDTMGHHVGDRMLQCFAGQLRSLTRTEDIRCRYGGDEFVAVLKRVDHAENAKRKSEIICQRFREMAEEEGCISSCSVGIAMSHADSGELEEVIARADEALYRAKQDNKGGCCVWIGKP